MSVQTMWLFQTGGKNDKKKYALMNNIRRLNEKEHNIPNQQLIDKCFNDEKYI